MILTFTAYYDKLLNNYWVLNECYAYLSNGKPELIICIRFINTL